MSMYYDNKLCVKANKLAVKGIMTKHCYAKMAQRGIINRVRTGCRGTPALVEWASIPPEYQNKYKKIYGDPREDHKYKYIMDHIVDDHEAIDFYNQYQLEDGRYLPPKKVEELITNAQLLNALHEVSNQTTTLRKMLNKKSAGVWESLATIISDADFQDKVKHNLPTNPRRLREKVKTFKNAEGNDYESLIPRNYLNKNRSKVQETEQEATLREFLRKSQNFDNAQVSMLYNMVAEKMGWDSISADTVGRYRIKWKLTTESGARGSTHFNNNMAMQVTRRAPSEPLLYWTVDGWDAELLYQQTTIDRKGNSVTTYHNRLTIVVVLDPCCKYPVGYAIGTHETPALIREAIRNAVNHTAELFGIRYRVNQLQTDNYSKKTLKPFYEALTELYTPAAVRNSKAKVIEPYFNYLNKTYCQFQNNWSGFGVTAKKENQPNGEYLNKIQKQFPDYEGCYKQLVGIIETDRLSKVDEYVDRFNNGSHKKVELTEMDYFYQLCETKPKTNQMLPEGLLFQINNNRFLYDTFEPKFRELTHIDWTVKYDPNNMERVMVHDEKGMYRFLLDEKHQMPMALADRSEGDSDYLHSVIQYNKGLQEKVLESMTEDYEVVSKLQINGMPAIDQVLSKFQLTDSNGQHKDQKSLARLTGGRVVEMDRDVEKEMEFAEAQDEYWRSKVNLNEYLNPQI